MNYGLMVVVQSIIRKESDTKFVHTQKRDVDGLITREIVGDELIMVRFPVVFLDLSLWNISRPYNTRRRQP